MLSAKPISALVCTRKKKLLNSKRGDHMQRANIDIHDKNVQDLPKKNHTEQRPSLPCAEFSSPKHHAKARIFLLNTHEKKRRSATPLGSPLTKNPRRNKKEIGKLRFESCLKNREENTSNKLFFSSKTAKKLHSSKQKMPSQVPKKQKPRLDPHADGRVCTQAMICQWILKIPGSTWPGELWRIS